MQSITLASSILRNPRKALAYLSSLLEKGNVHINMILSFSENLINLGSTISHSLKIESYILDNVCIQIIMFHQGKGGRLHMLPPLICFVVETGLIGRDGYEFAANCSKDGSLLIMPKVNWYKTVVISRV